MLATDLIDPYSRSLPREVDVLIFISFKYEAVTSIQRISFDVHIEYALQHVTNAFLYLADQCVSSMSVIMNNLLAYDFMDFSFIYQRLVCGVFIMNYYLLVCNHF